LLEPGVHPEVGAYSASVASALITTSL